MNKFAYKLVTAASTAVIALGSFGPAALGATTITISGNGSDSYNTANFTNTNTVNVTQSNDATVNNNVDVDGDTGDNDANDNTGGDVSIKTGDTDSTVKVETQANSNVANVTACCPGDTTVKITGNGTGSDNDADVEQTNTVDVTQINKAKVTNDVYVEGDTGENDANDNTGGDVEIETGDANSDVTVKTKVNANWASVGGDGEGGSVDVEISGNGSGSYNTVDLDLTNTTDLDQSNKAKVTNDVDVDGDTGDNDANDNTGGDVSIDTGDTDSTVKVTNEANFNAADLSGCGCEEDVTIKVAGNGTESDNDVTADLNSEVLADQINKAKVTNDETDVDGDTGGNDVNDNTAQPNGDPSIETGDANSDVEVTNTLNSNVLGDVEMPDLGDWSDSSFSGFILWMMAHWS